MIDPDPWREARLRMVGDQIAARGIRDARVLAALADVPRHLFVPAEIRAHAYDDGALTIGEGQTISQPYMVALMTEALRPAAADVVLELGTGSGYQAAVLARLVRKVWSVERVEVLAHRAHAILRQIGIGDIGLIVGDGPEPFAPGVQFDAILVTAGAPRVPPALRDRLRDGGRLVIPVGPLALQTLILVERRGHTYRETSLGSCVFVPYVGQGGWPASGD
jgi:protein-L-isoaspartate(D-aspartate) O-methyltransferase